MSRTRKPKMPKLRIPVAPPGYRHPSKKDYERVKKVEIEGEELPEYFTRESWDEYSEQENAREDLMFVLNRFSIKSASTTRVASYG